LTTRHEKKKKRGNKIFHKSPEFGGKTPEKCQIADYEVGRGKGRSSLTEKKEGKKTRGRVAGN